MSARPEPAGPGQGQAPDWAILLRGVNVGGANPLPMAAWRRNLAGLGFRDPQTLIQSGNAVLGAKGPAQAIAARIAAGLAEGFGIETPVFVLPEARLAAALDHPFGADADPARIQAIFLAERAPDPDLTRAKALLAPSEALAQRPGLLLLHAPQGVGRSRLAAALPRLLHGPVTARNLRTLGQLLVLLRSRIREDGAG